MYELPSLDYMKKHIVYVKYSPEHKEWCLNTFGECRDWYVSDRLLGEHNHYIFFENRADLVAFKLKFGNI